MGDETSTKDGPVCGAGVQADRVGGARAYDEGKIAVLAGLAAGAGLLLSQACTHLHSRMTLDMHADMYSQSLARSCCMLSWG
jgi:hypothetical protein